MKENKDIWGWIIEIENVFDKTKTNILINRNPSCIGIEKEISSIIQMFRKIENKISIYWLDNSQKQEKKQ